MSRGFLFILASLSYWPRGDIIGIVAELERPELLARARANVNRLRYQRNLRWRELAARADVSENALHNLNRGRPVSDLVLARVALVFGLELEQLFYNQPDEKRSDAFHDETDDWQATVRDVERYVRSITDPVQRAQAARHLLAVARGEVEAFERGAERREVSGRAEGDAAASPVQGRRGAARAG